MDLKIDWARTLRTLAVAALLLIALLGAVLGSIGLTSPVWNWAYGPSTAESYAANRDQGPSPMPSPRPA